MARDRLKRLLVRMRRLGIVTGLPIRQVNQHAVFWALPGQVFPADADRRVTPTGVRLDRRIGSDRRQAPRTVGSWWAEGGTRDAFTAAARRRWEAQ